MFWDGDDLDDGLEEGSSMKCLLYPLGGIASVVSFLSLVTAAGQARGWAGLGLLGAALAAPLAIAAAIAAVLPREEDER